MSKARQLADFSSVAPDIGRKNLIINGAMQVAQRGTSETGVTSMKYANAPDHYQLVINNMGAYTVSQSTDAPDGFANSYKIQCTTADASPAAGDYFFFWTKHEGQDVQHLKFGTASAQQLSLSFWVKSNMTGTWQVNFRDKDNGRLITGTYTTNSADTWEYKTITVDGDTGSSGFTNDNNESFSLEFPLGAGTDFTSGTAPTAWEGSVNANRAASNTVNIASSTSNYWAITGVQLEVGSVATPFEHRSYGEELALCQRYTFVLNGEKSVNDWPIAIVHWYNSNYARGIIYFPVSMRTGPTLIETQGSNYYRVLTAGSSYYTTNLVSTLVKTYAIGIYSNQFNSNPTLGYAGELFIENSAATIVFDAEL